jgi:predicted  nucleic acid-binding Zn-ribbon protein
MDGSNPWVTVVVALIAAFGGAPLFKYLQSRVQTSTAKTAADRRDFDAEKAEFRKERDAFWTERQKDAQSVKLENRTMRDAMTDLSNRNGWLEGQLARCNERVDELEAEVTKLRGNGHRT